MTDSISALNLEAGQVVGGYTLVSRLGGGAMGMVWTVRDAEGQLFAMKILRDSLAEDDDQARREQITARERLRREALTLSRVRHPGVASIVDMELDDALAFIVTELIDGDTLRDDVQKNGAYTGEDLELLTEKLASAVQAVHQAGIIHRDIKPTNVMISATGPVLVDFGIAMGEGESHVTRTGLVMGTPGFIAPEVIEGMESDELTDWWSVSSVLAFAATGRPVFGTKPLMAVLEREASGNADLSGLPPRTLAAFRSALSPRRQERIPVGQLLEVIRQDALDGASGVGSNLGSIAPTSAFPALAGGPGEADSSDQPGDQPGASGQTAVMRPFEPSPAQVSPRRLWVHDEPVADLPGLLTADDPAASASPLDGQTELLPGAGLPATSLLPTATASPAPDGWPEPTEAAEPGEGTTSRPQPVDPFHEREQNRRSHRELLRQQVPALLGRHSALYLILLLSLPLMALSAWLPLGGPSVALLICWLATARGYAVHAQILRESKRDKGKGRASRLIRVVSSPWHLLRSLPLLLPPLLLWALLYLLTNLLATSFWHLPILHKGFSVAGLSFRGIDGPLGLLTGSPRSLTGLVLALTALVAWLLTTLAHSRPSPLLTGLASAWSAISQRRRRAARAEQAATAGLRAAGGELSVEPVAWSGNESAPVNLPRLLPATETTTTLPPKSLTGICLAILLGAFAIAAFSLLLSATTISWSPLPIVWLSE